MKLSILAAAVAAVGIGAGSAAAQPAVLVPHRNHYHVVPAYPSYPAYGYRSYSPGLSFNLNFGSPRVYSPGFGYGGYSSGYRYGGFTPGWGGGHYHNGHYHNGHYHR